MHCDILDQFDLLLFSCMIDCADDRTSLRDYTYLVSEIMANDIVSSRDPKIFVSVNCICLPLVIESTAT